MCFENSEHRDFCAPILNPCYNEIVHAYVTTKELKRKGFTLKSENNKEAAGIQVTLTIQINLQMKKAIFNYQMLQNIFEIIDIRFTYTLQISLENRQLSAKHHNISDSDIHLFLSLDLMRLSIRMTRLRNRKRRYLCCSYSPNKNNIQFHLENLTKSLALYSSNYENLIILGDFNVSIDNSYMAGFCDTYDLRSLTMEPTYYKNPENPTCIDLISTNHPLSSQTFCILETGLSDFHKMTVPIMKASFQRLQPRIINYRDYRRFQNDVFREELLSELLDVSIGENEKDFSNFLDICKKNVNDHAPCKQKYVRGNHLPFMNKTLSKEIMKRTRLRNKFLNNKNDYNKREFSKQRNYCVSLVRKSKKLYYSNLDEKMLQIIKLLGRPLNLSYLIKLCQERK